MASFELSETEVVALRSAERMRNIDPAGYAEWVRKHSSTSSTATPPTPPTAPKHARDMTPAERKAALRKFGITTR